MLDGHTHTLSHPSISKIKAHGRYLIIKIYTEDAIDIRRHKETRNIYKYVLLAPLSTRRIRNEKYELCA